MLRSFLEKIQSLDRPGSERQPEVIFFLCALFFGLASLFITPPFQSPDEYSHFYRAYYTAQGGVIGSAIALPVPDSLVELSRVFPESDLPHNKDLKQDRYVLLAQFAQPYRPEPLNTFNINNTIYATPIPYLPQALGIRLGLLFSLAPISIFYLGRLVNLLVWIFLVLVAIRLTPVHRWVLVLIALMPMTLFLAASLSPDALLISLSFIFVAYFLRLLCQAEPLTTRQLAAVVGLAALITLSKHFYGLIAAIYLLMPVDRFGSRWRYLLVNGLLVGVTGVVTVSWYRWVTPLFIPNNEGASPLAQIQYIRSQPLQFAGFLLSNTANSLDLWTRKMIGILGWLDTGLPEFLYWIYLPALFSAALLDGNRQLNLPRRPRFGMFVIFIVFLLATAVSMFIQWTPVGRHEIAGVQGRYFIPFIWLLFLPFYNQRLSRFRPLLNLVVFLFLIISLDSMLYSLVFRYYL